MPRSTTAETPQPGDPAPSTPADHTLVGFLRRKLAGEPLPAAAGAHFHDSDIYVAEPDMLTVAYKPAPARKGEGESWWFFTQVRPKSSTDARKSRMVIGSLGTWHSERAPRPVLDDEGNCVGHSQYFSYKSKIAKNCKRRTDWYMVEYSEGQEGDHGRVHRGEPELVLCKIYRAHSGSRSLSSLRSERKRKATDEHVDQSSAPVKAKRRLFDLGSPAPTPVDASQEQVSSRIAMATSQLESQSGAAKFETEAYHGKIGGTLDDLVFWPEPEASQGLIDSTSGYPSPAPTPVDASQEQVSSRVAMATSQLESQSRAAKFETEAYHGKIGGTLDDLVFWPETEASQGLIDSTSGYLKLSSGPEASENKTSTTPPSLLMSQPEAFQRKIGDTSDFLRFWPEPSQGKIDSTSDYQKFSPETEELQNKPRITPPSLLMSEPEVSQRKIGDKSDYLRFWPEPSQGKTDGTSDYLKFSPETEELQSKTCTTPSSQMMSEPEVPALQYETTATFDCGIQMANVSTPPAPAHCYPMTDLMDDRYSSVFPLWGPDGWSSACNDSIVTPCSRSQGWFVGAPPMYNEWTTTGFAMSSASLLPPSVSPSSWCGSPALWSC